MVNFQIVQKYIEQNSRKNIRAILLVCVLPLILLFVFNATVWAPPRGFPIEKYSLGTNSNVSAISKELIAKKIIKSDFWFKSFVYTFSLGKHRIIAGTYKMTHAQSVWALAWRFSHGDFGYQNIKVTVPEGINSREMSEVFSKKLTNFNASNFLKIVRDRKMEGYLFPDTYFLNDGMTENEIIDSMNKNFDTQVNPIKSDIEKFGSFQHVIIMASILEKEARTQETRRIISGILWKRIQFFIPLQVDATLYYILGKTSSELTSADLKIDSPFNTYVINGLPPAPISNPGIEAIQDTIHPISTPYLYFLSDKDGNMHYAKTLEEHIENIKKYIPD